MEGDDKSMIFKAEYRAFREAETVLHEGLPRERLLDEYRALLESYGQLLDHMERIARISDLNQRKLFNSHEEAKDRAEVLYQAATTDELTRTYSRSYLLDFLEGAFSRAQRYQQLLSCLMLDIDDFKPVNDTFGHLAGDAVLSQLAATVLERVREGDVFGRLGGEEFLMILPNTSGEQALALARDICSCVEGKSMDLGEETIRITVSIGVSESDGKRPESVRDLIHQTDLALYQAKAGGKNRAVLFHEDQPSATSG